MPSSPIERLLDEKLLSKKGENSPEYVPQKIEEMSRYLRNKYSAGELVGECGRWLTVDIVWR